MTEFFYDDKRNLLAYRTPNNTGVSGETRLGDYIVFPNTLWHAQELAKRGFPVRDPLADYHFPGPYRRIDAQIMTTRFMLMNPRSFVLNDPRTGKTVSGLWAIDRVLSEFERFGMPASALVLSTKSTLYDPWGKHVGQTFNGARSYRVLTGSGSKRYNEFRKPAHIYISNYDGLRLIAAEGLPETIRIVVIDEFTAYKHATTKRYKHAEKCFARLPYFWVFSGTPVPDRSVDAYGPARLVHGLHGESHESFRNRCMYKVGSFNWIERPNAKDIAASALTPCIRFTRAQVIGLPNKLPIRTIAAPLSAEQAKYAEELKARTLAEIRGKDVTTVHAAAIRMKFLQVYQGILYDDEKTCHILNPSERLSALKEVLDEINGRALIFTRFSGVIDMLMNALHEYNPRYINGDVSAKRRLHIIEDFNRKRIGPIIGDPGTMGHGLDLAKGASTIVWWGPVDRNEHYQQANERIEGVNQSEPTQIIHMQSSKLERELYKRLEEKQSLQMGVLELVEKWTLNDAA